MHLHKWSKWQDATATYTSPLMPKRGSWTSPVQTRTCEKCGKTKVRAV